MAREKRGTKRETTRARETSRTSISQKRSSRQERTPKRALAPKQASDSRSSRSTDNLESNNSSRMRSTPLVSSSNMQRTKTSTSAVRTQRTSRQKSNEQKAKRAKSKTLNSRTNAPSNKGQKLNTPANTRRIAQRKAGAASIFMRVLAVIGILLVLGAISYGIARKTQLFSIDQIEAAPTEHLSQEDIAKLTSIEQGTTLLNYDAEAIKAGLLKNPWVESVITESDFPHTLRITIVERQVGALVLMSRGSLAWYIGSDDIWIEPITVTAEEDKSVREIALELAREKGAILVTDIPATVEPISGEPAIDTEIQALSAYAQGFSETFRSTITGFSAASVESISCTLDSGIEVSLGEPEQIEAKEAVIQELIRRFPTGITYINVRTPANPSYRRVSNDNIQSPTDPMQSMDDSI